MENKKIALIGGAGFVGTRLANRLNKSNIEHTIFDIDQSNKASCFLDVEDPATLNKLDGHNVIVNLAAVHRDDVKPISRYDDVNVDGANNICKAAIQNNITKIIFTSSVAVYGFAEDNTNEEGAINHFNDYGRTKYLAELIFKKWQKEDPYNRTLVIIRPTVIFGEGNRGNVFNLFNQIASKRFIMVGAGDNKKSMAYVENIAAFLEHATNFKNGIHVYNYIDKPDFSMNELVALVSKSLHGKDSAGLKLPIYIGFLLGYIADLMSLILRINLPISSIRVKKFISSSLFDSSASKTDFIAPVSLQEGLERTLKYDFIDDNKSKRTYLSE